MFTEVANTSRNNFAPIACLNPGMMPRYDPKPRAHEYAIHRYYNLSAFWL
jgi:hypothetical protein